MRPERGRTDVTLSSKLIHTWYKMGLDYLFLLHFEHGLYFRCHQPIISNGLRDPTSVTTEVG